MPNKRWIGSMNGGKGPKKGALHKMLGIAPTKKIPLKKLEKATKAPGLLGKRARLAETLKGFRKGK